MRVLEIIERLQKASPSKAVTKKQVNEVINRDTSIEKTSPQEAVAKDQVHKVINRPPSTKPKMHYRQLGRVFQKLLSKKEILLQGRGQYWIPEYLEKKLEYIKKQQELERSFWNRKESDIYTPTIEELSQKLREAERREHELELFYQDVMEQREHEEVLEKLRKKKSIP